MLSLPDALPILPCKWFPPLPLTQERDSGGRPAAAASQRGFTLVELMVMIVIIGLLATVVMINVMPSQDRAMIEKARADVSTLEPAVETYRLRSEEHTSELQSLMRTSYAV